VKRLGRWLLRGIGLALFAWLLSRAQWRQLGILLAQIELERLYAVPLLTVIMLGLRAWRWNLLLRVQKVSLSPLRAWSVYATGVFWGSFTPGRLGDLAKTLYLRQERQLSWEKAMAGALVDRLFDVFFMLVLSVWSIHHLGVWPVFDPRWVVILAVSGLVFAIFLKKASGLMTILRRWLRGRRFFSFMKGLRAEMGNLVNRTGLEALILTLFAYGIYFTQTALLARAIGLGLSVADVSAAVVLIGLAAFLPISIAGLGTREGLLALIMARKAIPDSLEMALMYSGLFFVFCFVFPALLGGLCWLKTPLSLQRITAREASWQ